MSLPGAPARLESPEGAPAPIGGKKSTWKDESVKDNWMYKNRHLDTYFSFPVSLPDELAWLESAEGAPTSMGGKEFVVNRRVSHGHLDRFEQMKLHVHKEVKKSEMERRASQSHLGRSVQIESHVYIPAINSPTPF